VVELVQSLGGVTYVRKRKPAISKLVTGLLESYEINIKLTSFNPFKLKRKFDKYNPITPFRAIENIELIGSSECVCISIDSNEKLYLTDNFIVTHNTFHNSFCIVDEFENLTHSQLKMAIGRLGKNSTMVFCGDADQIDLKRPLDSAFYSIERLQGSKYVSIIELKENHRHPAVEELLELLK
jgi:phosphate starvation-inducible PhoH-like protein